jgi:hypothetical protein
MSLFTKTPDGPRRCHSAPTTPVAFSDSVHSRASEPGPLDSIRLLLVVPPLCQQWHEESAREARSHRTRRLLLLPRRFALKDLLPISACAWADKGWLEDNT